MGLSDPEGRRALHITRWTTPRTKGRWLGWRVDRDELYSMAGVAPDDIDLVQPYDDYPVIVMLQFE